MGHARSASAGRAQLHLALGHRALSIAGYGVREIPENAGSFEGALKGVWG